MTAPRYENPLSACRLWQRSRKDGSLFLTGRWGGLTVLVVPNTSPRGDDDADYVLLFRRPREDAP